MIVGPLQTSIAVGLWCAALGLPVATAIGGWLARSRSPWKPFVSTLVFLPLVLPPVVTGLLLLRLLGRESFVGGGLDAIGLGVPFTFGAAVVAAFVVGLPLYVMAARSAFEAVDPRYEEVSLALGVPPARTFWRVTLPLASPGLAAGAVLAFARALGEFGATVILAGDTEHTRTIAIAVYALLDAPDAEGRVAPLVAASVAMSLFALIGYEGLNRWQRRRVDLEER